MAEQARSTVGFKTCRHFKSGNREEQPKSRKRKIEQKTSAQKRLVNNLNDYIALHEPLVNIRTHEQKVFVYDQVNPPSFLVAEPTDVSICPEGAIGGNLSAIGINSTQVSARSDNRSKKAVTKGSTQKLSEIGSI